MPLYEYKCAVCPDSEVIERLVNFDERYNQKCDKCDYSMVLHVSIARINTWGCSKASKPDTH